MGRGILQSGSKCGKNTSSGVNLKWLEIRCTGNGTVGSNPTHSANFLLKVFNQKRSDWTLSLYFTTFSSFFRPLYVGQILISCKFQCQKRLVQQGFPGFWRENRREKATPFPSEIQVLKAWHLPRTALCCSLDGHRCLPSWKNHCVPANPESASSEHRLPAWVRHNYVWDHGSECAAGRLHPAASEIAPSHNAAWWGLPSRWCRHNRRTAYGMTDRMQLF